jgi:hypothetical protein
MQNARDRVIEVSTEIAKEVLESQAMCGRFRVPVGNSLRK